MQVFDFGEQGVGVQHHAVADHAGFVQMDDARRDQVENELEVAGLYRVPGVRPALIPGHDVRVGRKVVDDLGLAFITPLGAQHHAN